MAAFFGSTEVAKHQHMAASFGSTEVQNHQHQQQFQYVQALPQQHVQYQQALPQQIQYQPVILGQPQHQYQQVLLGQPQAPPNMQPPRDNIYATVNAVPAVYARPSAVTHTHPAKLISRGVTPSVAHGTDFRVHKPERPRASALPGKPVREALPGSSAVPGGKHHQR